MSEASFDEDELMRWVMGDEESVKRFKARRRSPLSTPHADIMTSTSQAVWSRRVLDGKTMALVNLGIMSAINRPHELETRIRGLLRGGIKPEEIAEVFLQTAFYCGNPTGVEALITLVDAVDDMRERGTLAHEPVDPDTAPAT
ncbi:4-carboxymuconolactone decarboxylase [Frankia canadensis]|uniref:4-carboxymuconolactone decarboxylase n=1 Tax=Frankia canadensis TaxID=1836972 RepID=A0A2I2KHX7_9ACTN|nr:carboxymuconolactone decarboxylase family protein [Frankia canadensis]SNQ45262.1 4-carboxymuconolactone decarboxylase [Frankia canadensis]SOU52552.1 4-carboxymuconolactone decarboxylase [Frankia canadensis]